MILHDRYDKSVFFFAPFYSINELTSIFGNDKYPQNRQKNLKIPAKYFFLFTIEIVSYPYYSHLVKTEGSK